MQIAALILPLYSLSSFEVLTQNDCCKMFINGVLLNILRTETVREASYSPKNKKGIKSRNTRQSYCGNEETKNYQTLLSYTFPYNFDWEPTQRKGNIKINPSCRKTFYYVWAILDKNSKFSSFINTKIVFSR